MKELSIVDISSIYTNKKKEKVLALKHVSFEMNSSDFLTIVGPTGCGKTTLINLLMRFYDVNSGAIKVNDIDVRKRTRRSLRSSIGMVLQETWLKSGTIRENIVMGNPEATDEEIIAATKKYVESFNGNYTYMQILKYFISKQKPVEGAPAEQNSQFLSYLQNPEGDTVIVDNDWTANLV